MVPVNEAESFFHKKGVPLLLATGNGGVSFL